MKSRTSIKKRAGNSGHLSLRLYVAGRLPGSLEAETILRTLCAENQLGSHEFEIVDLLQEPNRALADGIIATPTLVRLSPTPQVRILGGLSDLSRVRSTLGLKAGVKGEHD